MKGSAQGLLVIVVVILYFIIQLIPYILITLVIIGVIAIIIYFDKANDIFQRRKTNNHIKFSSTHANSVIAKITNDNEAQNNQLNSLYTAHQKSDIIINKMGYATLKMIKYVEIFYNTKEYTRIGLFEYIIEQLNHAISSMEDDYRQEDIVRAYKIIIYEIEQLKKGASIENIIHEYSKKYSSVTTHETLSIIQKTDICPNLQIAQSEELQKRIDNNVFIPNEIMEDVADDANESSVPYWAHYYVYSATGLSSATLDQKRFYTLFKYNFLKGTYLDLQGNYNYAFILLFDLINDYKEHRELIRVQNELNVLGERYPKTKPYAILALDKAIIDYKWKETIKPIIITPNILTTKIDKSARVKKEHLTQKCEWIKEGHEITIRGYKISRGNFYYGEKFLIPKQILDNYFHEGSPYLYASVINPDLEIIRDNNDTKQFHSYDDMHPALRGQYLKWLAGEIDYTVIPDELISFHLFGLELRLFIDTDTTTIERKSILKEIIKLRDTVFSEYRCNSIQTYHSEIRTIYYSAFNNCIDNAITKFFSDNPLEFISKEDLKTFRIYKTYIISEHFKANNIIDCKSAYDIAKEWYYDVDRQAPNEHESFAYELFSREFKKSYKEGIKANSYPHEERYYINNRHSAGTKFFPESNYLSCNIITNNFYIWEVENAIRNCYDTICHNFYGYNRALRSNNGKQTLEALFLLPKQIDISMYEKVKGLIIFLDKNFIDNKYPVINVADILDLWDFNQSESSLPKRIIDSIQASFDELGYGIAPDYRVHGFRFKKFEKCVLFTKTRKSPIETDFRYKRMLATIKMSIILAQADNEITAIEQEFILQYVKSQIINPTQFKYLLAYFEFSKLTKQIYTGFKQYPLLFTKQSIEELLNFLIKLACIDNEVNGKEIDAIKKIMSYFDADCEGIHSKIHRIFTGEDSAPITIATESGARNYTIPAPNEYIPEFSIDTIKLLQIEKDTVKSKIILSEIFASDEEDKEYTPININQHTKLIEILEILLAQESWSRVEVERLCTQHSMMVGSVLESINDYSYSVVGDAVVEDNGETICITTQYKEQLICQNK